MPNLFDLLQQVANDEAKTIACKRCGQLAKSNQDNCLHCGFTLKMPTMQEYGSNLPIGIYDGQALHKEFEARPVTFQVEKSISETWHRFRRKGGAMATPFDYVLHVLSHTIESLAGKDFQKMKHQQRLNVLKKMYDGDPWYIFAWVRNLSLGNEMVFNDIKCFHCGDTIESFVADLNTLEIATIENVDGLRKKVVLTDGFEYLGRDNCKNLIIEPVTVQAHLRGANKSPFEASIEQICESVVAVEDRQDITLSDAAVASMSKADRDYLLDEIDRHSGGPDWRVEVDNCSCGQSFHIGLPAVYDDFFKRSFRYVPGRNY